MCRPRHHRGGRLRGGRARPTSWVTIAQNRLLFWGLLIAQLGIVFVMSARVEKLSPAAAAALFIAYSGLTGVTMAFVLLVYTGASVASTFVVTAGMFGSLALFGTVTSRSLAGWGQFLFMGLIGVVLASVVGIFWQNDALQFVIAFMRRDRVHRASPPTTRSAFATWRCRCPTAGSARTASSARWRSTSTS